MYFRQAIVFLLVSFMAHMSAAQTYTVGTFNLRYDNPRDSGNLWKDRAPLCAALIRFHDFDFLGTQEGLKNQLDDLLAALPEYALYGAGRDDGKDKGEHSAILYKKEKFKVLQQGDFWLSLTPENPGPGWDARLNRICSWLQLQEIKSKKQFFVFNVHYDHQGIQARKESSKLLLKKIREIAGNGKVVLTGDFNGGHESEWYQTLATAGLLQDTYTKAEHPYAPNGTGHAFGKSLQHSVIIDHIFTTAGMTVNRWGILTDSFHGKFPSDHFPVLASITL